MSVRDYGGCSKRVKATICSGAYEVERSFLVIDC